MENFMRLPCRSIEDDGKRDNEEGRIHHKNKLGQKCTSVSMFKLISCWTVLKGNRPSRKEWEVFGKSNNLALISTPEKVKACIENKMIKKDTSGKGKTECWRVEHKKVDYYEIGAVLESDTVFDGFHKNIAFTDENEYRFVVDTRSHIDTLIFYACPKDYCYKAIINTKKRDEFFKAYYEEWEIDRHYMPFIENSRELAVRPFPGEN